MRNTCSLSILATILACTCLISPANAAARDRVFVASYGSDSNPCTFGSPCKTFQQAINIVAAGGEVTAIDSAGFGPISITQSVTITSPTGVEAGIVAAPGSTAISIAAGSTGAVVLRGLTLEGAGTAANGISVSSAARLEIVDCAVHNFTNYGISVESSNAMTILISKTVIADDDSAGPSFPGIFLDSVTGSIAAALDSITVTNNDIGVFAFNGGAPIDVLISNSHIDNNVSTGILVGGSGPGAVSQVVLKNVTVSETPTAILLDADSVVWLSQVTQTTAPGFTSVGVALAGGATGIAHSDGTNHFMGGVSGGSLQSWTTE